MQKHSLTLILILFIIKTGFTFDCDPTDYSNKIRDILSAQNNYDIIEGKLIFLFNSTAFFANPTSIYGVYFFPSQDVNVTEQTVGTYFLRSSNAIIFGGCTAPQSKYISVVSYLFKRFNYIENNSTHKQEILFASLGDSLNDLVWNTSNSSNPYDALTTIIETADKQTFNDINNLLTKNGISSSEINLQSLPSQYINFLPYQYNADNVNTYTQTYDTGGILYRIAIPLNKDEYNQYIHQNQTIFMVQPKNAQGNTPRIPFDPQTRNTFSNKNVNEFVKYNDSLNEYKSDLISYIEKTYNMRYKGEDVLENTFCGAKSKCDYGFSCIDNNTDCGGDNRDAQYWKSGNIKLKNNSFYIVLGIMHTNIEQTVYSNIVIYEKITQPGPAITNLGYNGSALLLPVKTNVAKDDLENMFIVQFGRPHSCIQGLPGWCLTEQQLDYNTDNEISARNYLNPYTMTRPNLSEIIPNHVLEFETKS